MIFSDWKMSLSKGDAPLDCRWQLSHSTSLVVIEQGAENDNGCFIRSGHGIRLGGHDQGAHVRGHQLQVRVLREELVDLFFEGRHRRLAGGQQMENNFKCFYFHFALFV